MKRRYVGRLMVDSGQLFVIDPCYLADWHHGDYVATVPPDNSYARVITAMFDQGPTEVEGGIVVPTDGDGMYPLYVTEDERGRVVKIEILLDAEGEDEDDD